MTPKLKEKQNKEEWEKRFIKLLAEFTSLACFNFFDSADKKRKEIEDFISQAISTAYKQGLKDGKLLITQK